MRHLFNHPVMNIQPLQASYPRVELITSSDSFFGTVKEDFVDYKHNGFFLCTAEPGLFVYQIQCPRRSYTGLIGTSDIEGFLTGKILQHEATLAPLEQVQVHLLFQRNAAVKPVLMGYAEIPEIEAFLQDFAEANTPLLEIEFELESQTHRVWQVSRPEQIRYLQEEFDRKVDKAYIADGHHRTATMAHLFTHLGDGLREQYRFFLSAYFSFSNLEIFDFNRVVQGLDAMSPTLFMARLSQVCEIEVLAQPAKPEGKHQVIMFFNQEWYSLRWKDTLLAKYEPGTVLLDTFLLNDQVLGPLLGITDVRNDKRIRYIEGTKAAEGLRDAVLRGEGRIGFMLYPVDWEDFLSVSEKGGVMPPKSTLFEPRMKNGILVQEF